MNWRENIILWREGDRYFLRYGKLTMEIERWWFEHMKADDRAIVKN